MGEDGHARFLQHPRDQPLAAARHDEVDQARRAQHRAHEGAVGGGGDLHRGLGQAGRAQALRDAGMDGGGGTRALGAAAQDDRIAGFQAQRRGIGGDVGAAFEDHADDAERLRDAAHHQAIGARPFGEHAADRVGQGRDILEPRGHRLDPRRRQHQPVAEGAA